jgi:KUP system potassium uptake protein
MTTTEPHAHHGPKGSTLALSIGAIGVVFGDIGTSPLYTLQMAAADSSALPDVLGVLSMIFWGLTLVVALKYLVFIMRADNRGEGGILALLALIPTQVGRRISWITLMVVAGAALLFGDGIITPAISVLSAIEGLRLAAPDSFPLPLILAITVVILIGLFAIQRQGTGAMGRLFGPVMVTWFVTIGALGAYQIAHHPEVLAAINPLHGVRYFAAHGWHGFPILGVVVLCLTGGEALYADMGHFGARPIRIAWATLAMPALVLCYFGQGGLLLSDPRAVANPFFSLVPLGVPTYLLVGLATFATIIASQALISGVFSLTHQAVQLGLFPRVTVRHTSADAEGQIYVPEINWMLMVACCLLVVGFQESSKLAAAFGIAVSGTMAITSIAYYLVTRRTWGWPAWKSLPLLLLFLSFDLPFFAANLLKFFEGGYVPIVVGAFVFTVMVVWKIGRRALAEYTRAHASPIAAFLEGVDARVAMRVPGTAVFMTSAGGDVPLILEHHLNRIHVLHAKVVLLTVTFEHIPTVAAADALEFTDLGHGFTRLLAHYGYMDEPNIPRLLRAAEARFGLALDLDDATYYLGRETLLATKKGELGPLTEGLYAFLARNAASATSYFALPPDNVIELGAQIDL